MSLDEIIVAAASILGIFFTYWFFLTGRKEENHNEHMSHH